MRNTVLLPDFLTDFLWNDDLKNPERTPAEQVTHARLRSFVSLPMRARRRSACIPALTDKHTGLSIRQEHDSAAKAPPHHGSELLGHCEGDRGVEDDFLLVQNGGGEEVDIRREGCEPGRVHAARRSREKRMEPENDA